MSARWLVKSEQRITNESLHACFVIKFMSLNEALAIEKIRLL